MTLEFEKVVPQVERMGRALAARSADATQRTQDAWELLKTLDDLETIRERILLVRDRDAGYRGAAPAFNDLIEGDDQPIDEPLNRAYPLPALPGCAAILAADGSQVYPSSHSAALYYLLNVGVFMYYHGREHLPEQVTDPRLFYADEDLRDSHGQMITNELVNRRRSVQELRTLAREAAHRPDLDCPLLALADGPLLFWSGKNDPEGARLEHDYFGMLVYLHDTHAALSARGLSASLAGYIDRPRSTFLIGLLHLMSLADDDVRASALQTNGDFEGLFDQMLMFKLLKPGERSALMVQQSPQNKAYRLRGNRYEIAFFYLNVGLAQDYHLARVELPMWVARQPALVDRVHALLVDQCQMMWRYPYALTRADELAVVRGHEREQLNGMIEQELLRHQQVVEQSEKLESKIVRHGRTRYGQRRKR